MVQKKIAELCICSLRYLFWRDYFSVRNEYFFISLFRNSQTQQMGHEPRQEIGTAEDTDPSCRQYNEEEVTQDTFVLPRQDIPFSTSLSLRIKSPETKAITFQLLHVHILRLQPALITAKMYST